MAAKVGADPVVYAKYVPGTHFQTLAEAKANYKGDAGAAINTHDSMVKSDKVLLDIGAYKNSQKADDYIDSSIVLAIRPDRRRRWRGFRCKYPRNMGLRDRLGLRHELPPRRRFVLTVLSFLLPVALWSIVSYVPWIWHPLVRVTDPGGVDYFQPGMDVDHAVFAQEAANMLKKGLAAPVGHPANPMYLPAPHKVAMAMVTAFTTPPRLPSEPWLHESHGRSIRTLFWGFLISSLLGVPLGILCGTYRFFSRLKEPFIEFFRYLPAPAFSASRVSRSSASMTRRRSRSSSSARSSSRCW